MLEKKKENAETSQRKNQNENSVSLLFLNCKKSTVTETEVQDEA